MEISIFEKKKEKENSEIVFETVETIYLHLISALETANKQRRRRLL